MSRYLNLEDCLQDDAFPDVDFELRRGRHVTAEDDAWYTFLIDGEALLEPFYRRLGAALSFRTEGYFYLIPLNERLGRRQLSPGEMLVGQALTLLYLDPQTAARGGLVSRDEVLGQLAGVMGTDALLAVLHPKTTGSKRKKADARAAEEGARQKVTEALRRLAALGFVSSDDTSQVRLRASLMRFAEPVREGANPAQALSALVAKGELVLEEPVPVLVNAPAEHTAEPIQAGEAAPDSDAEEEPDAESEPGSKRDPATNDDLERDPDEVEVDETQPESSELTGELGQRVSDAEHAAMHADDELAEPGADDDSEREPS